MLKSWHANDISSNYVWKEKPLRPFVLICQCSGLIWVWEYSEGVLVCSDFCGQLFTSSEDNREPVFVTWSLFVDTYSWTMHLVKSELLKLGEPLSHTFSCIYFSVQTSFLLGIYKSYILSISVCPSKLVMCYVWLCISYYFRLGTSFLVRYLQCT